MCFWSRKKPFDLEAVERQERTAETEALLSRVGSATALISMVESIDALELKESLIATIKAGGISFVEYDLLSRIAIAASQVVIKKADERLNKDMSPALKEYLEIK